MPKTSDVSDGLPSKATYAPLPPFLAKLRALGEDEFRRYATQRFRDVNAFESELERHGIVDRGSMFSMSAARRFRSKNRYSDISPYDGNRVKLHGSIPDPPGEVEDDYINASLVRVLYDLRTFIAAQGPLSHTTADFWEMIWEQKSRVVVMVTREEENGREKVYRYWPKAGSKSYSTPIGNLTVTLVSVAEEGDMIERRFALTVDDSTAREVVQVQFIGWPDHGIPDSHGHMVDVLERANLAQKAFIAAEGRSSAGPMVVHCSAGCGRTGTIIALDTFLRLMDLDLALAAKRDPDVLTESPSLSDKVDWNKDWIFEIVKQLRTQRTTMVQAFDQYRFLYLEIMARLGAE